MPFYKLTNEDFKLNQICKINTNQALDKNLIYLKLKSLVTKLTPFLKIFNYKKYSWQKKKKKELKLYLKYGIKLIFEFLCD